MDFNRKRNKYLNVKTEIDGINFDSRKEANFYLLLKQKKENKEIKSFELQVFFELIPKTKLFRASGYRADFVIINNDGTKIIIDVKSEFTRKNPLYIFKKKMMFWIYGIEIKEGL